jgi:cystathionine beta-lyase/cystathionine gamma-synthase
VLCAVLAYAGAGDVVAVQSDAYGGTLAMLRQDLAQLGIRTVATDPLDPADVARALRPADGTPPPRLLLVETLSNPLLRAVDVPALVGAGRAAGVPVVVDNTFATPVFRRPLADGADLVVHSATKFLGGHHDLCAGVLAGRPEIVEKARGIARRLGTTVAPFDAWLCSRGIRTLAVRMERSAENARRLAEFLAGHPAVAAVRYPGWGALVTFDTGSLAAADAVLRASKLIPLVPSLGGTDTTFSHPATSSHRGLSPEARRALGIGDGMLRMSVGIEAFEDLRADLAQALADSSAQRS